MKFFAHILFVVLIFCSFLVSGQTQIGQTLEAEGDYDLFSFGVAMSASGDRIAVGAPRHDGNGTDQGRAYLYNYVGGQWTEAGTAFYGDVAQFRDEMGMRVALSGDGTVLAAAAPGTSSSPHNGYVRLFREVAPNDWQQIGQDIFGDGAGDRFGRAISLSDDGNRLVVGVDLSDAGGTNAGQVKVFELQNNVWTQLGNAITGTVAEDRLGTRVVISASGDRIAVGIPFNDAGGNSAGMVRVYELNAGAWVQVGANITGGGSNHTFGNSIDLSDSGTRLVIGASGAGSAGEVKVYDEDQNTWTQVGNTVTGTSAAARLGASVAISGDGTRFSARAFGGGINGDVSVQTFDLDGGTWTKTGGNLSTGQVSDIFGAFLQLSQNGERIITSAHQGTVNGLTSGQARVFYLYPAGCDGDCPTCSDGVINGQETGLDCGGPDCPSCSTCDDGVQNGAETGVDCGGPNCPSCFACGQDYDALMALYDATDGPNWENRTGWEAGSNGDSCDPCNFNGGTWYGVGCDAAGRVTCVDLDSTPNCTPERFGGSSNGLNGPLPVAFFDLPFLRHLSLENNELPGPIPAEIGTLSNLRYLNLRNCSFTGALPATLGDLTELEEIRIGFDDFTGVLPVELAQLTKLKVLSIDLIELTGGIPQQFRNLIQLEEFNLTGCRLGGDFPDWFDELPLLSRLAVEGNFMNGPLPASVYDLTELRSLDIGYNFLGSSLSPDIAKLTKLSSLGCRNGGLTGPLPDVFDQLPDLTRCQLEYNALTGEIPATLAEHDNIFSLVLRNNQLSGPIPDGINANNNLMFLALNNNQLEGCIPAGLAVLCGNNINLQANPQLAYSGDFGAWCANGSNSVNAPCDDGDPLTGGDAIDADCNCVASTSSCGDGIQNDGETGIDCGGPNCPVCPTCSDGLQNGGETGVDCGGPDCADCPNCNDGMQNNGETDVDCGGPNCVPCSFVCTPADYPITVDPRGAVASIQLPAAEYASWVQNDDYSDGVVRRAISAEIYCRLADEFDFLIFLLNEDTRPSSIPYSGKYFPVQNDAQGIGTSLFDNSGEYGSAGRLQGTIHLPARTLLRSGPALHELMHRWGNFGITTHSVQQPGQGISSFNFQPHWGFTGGSNKGQLGGFDQSTLQELGNNTYRVGNFAPFANGGNSQPYTELERYLAGFLALEDVNDFDVFTDITSLDISAGSTYDFVANQRTTFTSGNLTTALGGARQPNVSTSQKDFRSLVIVVTGSPLTQAQWDQAHAESVWWGTNADDGTSLYNFWEATQGAATMQTGGLLSTLPVTMTTFTARPEGKQAVLAWATATETNNDFFAVEHATDATNWTEIGRVDGTGTSQISQAYRFRHADPATGSNYYRLRQTDTDGTYTYSGVRTVVFSAADTEFIAYPNPVSGGETRLIIPEAYQSGTVQLYSVGGRLLKEQSARINTLETHGLPAGTYLLKLQGTPGSLHGKLVVR